MYFYPQCCSVRTAKWFLCVIRRNSITNSSKVKKDITFMCCDFFGMKERKKSNTYKNSIKSFAFDIDTNKFTWTHIKMGADETRLHSK